MTRIAFKMYLQAGKREEYKKRHDDLWPEVKTLLKDAGISEYSIFVDEQTSCLFAVMNIVDPGSMATLRESAIMHKWWGYMQDLLESDNIKPISVPLEEVFYLS